MVLKKEKFILEPAIMYSGFNGSPYSILFANGKDRLFDAGINFYFEDFHWKASLHCVLSDGKSNSLFGSGAARRGDMIGFGLQYNY